MSTFMNRIFWGCCLIIGIINIALSLLNARGILFHPKGIINDIVSLILPFQGTEVSLSAIYQIFPKLEPFIKNFLSPFIGYTISIILLISGIGVILRKSYGRTLAYTYAISIIFLSTIGIAISVPNYLIMYNEIKDQGPLSQALAWGGIDLYFSSYWYFVISYSYSHLLLPAQD